MFILLFFCLKWFIGGFFKKLKFDYFLKCLSDLSFGIYGYIYLEVRNGVYLCVVRFSFLCYKVENFINIGFII